MSFTDDEIRALYTRYGPVLFRRCRAILGNDEASHDVVQDTFARVLRHGDAFRQQASPLTWMYRISTNLCLNQLRNQRSRSEKLERHAKVLHPPPHSPVAVSDHQRVRDLLDEVDEQTRQVIVHLFFDDCTRRETAELVGITPPTVRKRLAEFLELARTRLDALAVPLLLLWATTFGSP